LPLAIQASNQGRRSFRQLHFSTASMRGSTVKVVHICNKVTHVVSGASQVEQGADYGGSSDRIATYICLNVSRVVILVEVDDEVGNKVVTVTNNDERPLISELGLLEEVTSANGVVVVEVTTRMLNFPELSHVSSSLDVLEVDLWTLGVGVHLSKEVKETFVGVGGLKEADQSIHGELNDEFDCNGHHNWQVLEDVNDKHVMEDIEAVFGDGDLTKKVHEEQLTMAQAFVIMTCLMLVSLVWCSRACWKSPVFSHIRAMHRLL
jgi:hypothetical protein